jgi:hypothetical protein
MSSEILGGAQDVLKGNLGGAWDVKHGYADAYTDLGIARKFGGAAAAYSLRDIGAMNGPVVRVRRESDNAEADFSASAVPFISDWVNRQTVKPLDIQALNSGGSGVRDGDFQIASAAYSLRSLGARQATVAATGDTVAAPNGKYVVQVRRSKDNTIKSFTADEVSDGTLVNFVTEPSTGWNTQPTWNTIAPSGTIRSQSSTASTSTLTFFAYGTSHTISDSSRPSHIVANEGDVVDINLTVSNISGSASVEIRAAGTDTALAGSSTIANGTSINASFTVNSSANGGAHIVFSSLETPGDYSDGTITINSVTVTGKTGFVRTWYDQSVTDQGGGTATGNHATQTTAAEQPKIVSSGSLVVDSSNNPAIIGDGTDDTLANATLTDQLDNSDFLVIAAYENAMAMGLSGAIPRMYLTSSSMSYNTNRTITYTIATGQKIISFQTVGDTQEVFSNGASVGTASQSQVSFGSNEFNLLRGGSDFSSQPISEVIVYASNQTDNRGAYEGNIADHYSITGVPTGANTVNGFVETWYDQSGNSRPLIQTTATEQPLIVENGVFLNGVKANEATSNSTMQNLQVSTDGTNANFGTDDWASGASSKLGLIYVGTVVDVVNPSSDFNNMGWRTRCFRLSIRRFVLSSN